MSLDHEKLREMKRIADALEESNKLRKMEIKERYWHIDIPRELKEMK